jgi:hypothetical protein
MEAGVAGVLSPGSTADQVVDVVRKIIEASKAAAK